MELTKEYIINGPVNIVRLTNGEKILYIFGDYHLKTEIQNECPINDKHDSIDIDKFLFKFMKKEKIREFDMFIEDFYLDPSLNTTYKKRYIDNVNKLFNSKINFKDNKIYTLKEYSNFRFHYFDIRNLLYLENELFNYSSTAIPYPYSYLNLKYILTDQNILNDKLNDLLNYYIHSEEKVIAKIKTKYNHKEIKDKINLIYNDIIVENLKSTIKINKKLIKLLEESIDNFKNLEIYSEKYMKMQSKIYIELYLIKEYIMDIYVVTTDLNFIRRFLDKDYIKNTIIYTGLRHLSDISYILIKYFNFKLTNIYHQHDKIDISKMNDIKNFKYLKKLDDNFYNLDENMNPIQCSNLLDFPNNFN
jgi:hypothetical protein